MYLKSLSPKDLENIENLVLKLFKGKPSEILPIKHGYVNKVCKIILKDKRELLVKLNKSRSHFVNFQKEKWCIEMVKRLKVPVPHVYEVGNSIVPCSYSVMEYVEHIPGDLYEKDHIKIWEQLGFYASRINRIETKGFGKEFQGKDWFNFNNDLNSFVDMLLSFDDFYESVISLRLLKNKEVYEIKKRLSHLQMIPYESKLIHGDLWLKNVMVNDKGKITAIIDWDYASAGVAPYMELAGTLETKSTKEEDAFLSGFGVSRGDYLNMTDIIGELQLTECIMTLYRTFFSRKLADTQKSIKGIRKILNHKVYSEEDTRIINSVVPS